MSIEIGDTFIVRECPTCKRHLYADTDDGPWSCPKCDPDQFQTENPDIPLDQIPACNNMIDTDTV